jgi:hypothetical protein
MRSALFAGLVLGLAPLAGFAQSGPVLATVADPEVKLRAGPSDQFPEVARLSRGAVVIVDHEEPNGWLAVQDAPGTMHSLSWVQAAFIDFDNTKPVPQNVMVHDDTTLAVGQLGLAQPLTQIRRAKVPSGTILTVIGPKVTFEGKLWHPVVPPPGDFRYLPKQAVRFEKAANTSFVVRDGSPTDPPAARPPSGGAAGTSGSLPSDPGTGANPSGVSHPLWAQAEAAERAGNYDEAEKLFFQLARVMNEPGGDHTIANLCYTRIHTLREKKRSAPATTSRPVVVDAPTRPQQAVPPAGSRDTRDDRARWTGVGRLTRTSVVLDGRKTYALEANPGEIVLYVTPAAGVDLDRYVGRKVDLYGTTLTRRDLSKPYVVVSAVELAR